MNRDRGHYFQLRDLCGWESFWIKVENEKGTLFFSQLFLSVLHFVSAPKKRPS